MIDGILLAPYYLALKFRHFLYDHGILKSVRASVPTVCFGNITVGGTGKTPHTEMTLRTLLSMEEAGGRHFAVLSRGYRRKSRGFQQVTADSTASFSGDEPLQMKLKFPEVTVAVDADRVEGCGFLSRPEKLKTSKRGRKCVNKEFLPADLIVLDDAFQHRSLKPDLSILLIDWNRPVMTDHLLPIGRLRDLKERVAAADAVIVTKCPTFIGGQEKQEWLNALGVRNFDPDSLQGTIAGGRKQTFLFSAIKYCSAIPVFPDGDARYVYSKRAILATGIANDTPLRSFLAGQYRIVRHLAFGDHHRFSPADIRAICSAADSEPTAVVVTTEKDAQRLCGMKKIPETLRKRMFQVPIEAVFLTEHETAIFRKLLQDLL